jgi:hypothetical protein
VYYLLDNGADLNYSGGRLNEIPLQWAVRNEKYVTALKHLQIVFCYYLDCMCVLHIRFCYIRKMVWYGMVWYGMVWYGMVWYGMVWYGMVWYGMV